MVQAPAASRRTPVGANMTPMIDVVFLLIIFFLVSSHLAKQETRPPLDLPTAGPQLAGVFSAERLTVNINADHSISVSGASVDAQRLAALMRLHAEEHGTSAAVRIRTDRSIPYALVEPVLRQAALAGVTQITFAVREDR